MKFFCDYCGSRIDAEVDKHCPKCGAPYKENENFKKMTTEQEKQVEEIKQFQQEVTQATLQGMKVGKIFFVIVFTLVIFIMVFTMYHFFRTWNSTPKVSTYGTSVHLITETYK